MSESRRLGKGLEEISHLFLSSGEEKAAFKTNAGADAGKIPPDNKRTPKYICLVGDEPDLHHAFFVVQLSLALTRSGMRIAVVDMDEDLPCFHFLTGGKAGSDTSINSHRVIREGRSGVKVVGFSETIIAGLSETEAADRVLNNLRHIEEEHDVILISVVQGTLLKMETVLPDPLREFILFVARDKFKMLAAYKTIKSIFSLHPLAHAGIIITPIRHAFEADLVHDRMSGAVEKFLGRELHRYGFLYKSEKEPDAAFLSDSFCEADVTTCISNIVQNLVSRVHRTGSSSQGHFFSNLCAGYGRTIGSG